MIKVNNKDELARQTIAYTKFAHLLRTAHSDLCKKYKSAHHANNKFRVPTVIVLHVSVAMMIVT